MDYSVKYLPEERMVKIIIHGRLNFTTARKYSKEAIKLARENNCSKFLIDHTKTKLIEDIHQIYTDGAVLEQFGFQVTDKIAIIIECKQDDALLLERLTNNIKWSNFRYFNISNEAVAWLIEDKI
jgi:hypothetical protein